VERISSAYRNSLFTAAILALLCIAAQPLPAAITLTGNTSPVYNNTNPWAVISLIVGNTALGTMTVNAGSVVNNTGAGKISNALIASPSDVVITGAGSKWTNTTDLYVGYSGTATLNVTDGGTLSNNAGFLGYNNGASGEVTIGGGTGTSTWTNSQNLYVGYNGLGSVAIQGGGKVVCNSSSYIGYGSIDDNHVYVGGGTGAATWTTTLTLYVATQGNGTLDVTGGGNVTCGGGYIGYNSGDTGIVNVGGGTGASKWTTGALNLGTGGAGTLHITGGGTVLSSNVYIGDGLISSFGSGTVTVGGGVGTSTWTNANYLYVGQYGTGSLTITGGGIATNLNAYIGYNASSNGTVNVGGGTGTATWTSTGPLAVGYNGNGTLNITGGGNVSSASATIGGTTGRSGAVTIGGGTGTATWTSPGDMVVSGTGAATLNITGGGTVSDTTAYIGSGFSAIGTATIGGGTGTATWTNSGEMFVGYNGNGTLNITGGGTVFDTNGSLGRFGGSTGTATVGGGTGTSTWTNSGTLYVGRSGTGVLNINTGGLVTAAALAGGNATSSLKFGGGTLRITATGSASNTISLLSGGGTLDIPTAGTTFTVTSPIAGAGGLTKTGVGTLTLTGANTYTGGTTISEGTLLANNTSGSATGTTTVAVSTAGVLGGTGTVSGNVTSNGTLAPGSSAGTLKISGNYTQNAAGKLQIEFASASSFDQLKVGGSATLAGTLELLLLGGYMPAPGAQFDVLDFATLTGTFDSIVLPTLDPALRWDISKIYSSGLLRVNFAGDFDAAGTVDAADYVVWRKGLNTTYTQADYDVWRSNFGQPAGSGAGASANTAVPEPAMPTLLIIAAAGWCLWRGRNA
jgi:fibronectin-binding autotransporter adhesin